MGQLNVKLQTGIRRALDDALYRLNSGTERVTLRSVVKEALEAWLEHHEGNASGGEKRTSGPGKKNLPVEIDDHLENRLRREYLRRKKLGVKPKKKRTIVEAALIEWMLKRRFNPGVKIPSSPDTEGDD